MNLFVLGWLTCLTAFVLFRKEKKVEITTPWYPTSNQVELWPNTVKKSPSVGFTTAEFINTDRVGEITKNKKDVTLDDILI